MTYKTIEVGLNNEVVSGNKKKPQSQIDHLSIARTPQRITYATDEGRGLLGRLDELEKRIDGISRQKEDLDDTFKRFDDIPRLGSDLGAKVMNLKKASNGYLDLRRRWLDSYKRDYRGEELTTKFVDQGIHRAQEADVETDAFIFEEDRRCDQSLFLRLYVFESRQIQSLQLGTKSSENLLDTLNQRATAITQGHEIPVDVDKAFTTLVKTIENADLQPDFSNPTDEMGFAYSSLRKEWNAFQSMLNEERKEGKRWGHNASLRG